VHGKNKKEDDSLIKDSRQIALEKAMAMEEGKEKLPEEDKKEEESLEKIKEKAALAASYYDQLLRLRAEFDNYRKRINKERGEYQETAKEEIIYQLLSIIDNFERAMKAAEETKNFEKMFEGIKLIHKQVNDFLASHDVNVIEAEGKKYDPEYHEAVAHEESDKHAEDTVTEEVLKGYTFKDKVLRPAVVKVAKKRVDSVER
jgi:molecular chaperone GrpE